ncbi:MAG TPA: hypothetical protein H9669_10045 [Firmicutes bacterium]|nr:hypothetical protein [Bacillota bacterium]
MLEQYRPYFVETIRLAKLRDESMYEYLKTLDDDTLQAIMTAMYLGREYIYYPGRRSRNPEKLFKEWREYIGSDEYAAEVIDTKKDVAAYLKKTMYILGM